MLDVVVVVVVVVALVPRREGRAEEDVIVRVDVVLVVVEVVEVVEVVVAEEADVARPSTGGVATRAGVLDAEEGLGVEGLDHDSKKSSSASSLGLSAAGVSRPST